MQTTWFNNLMSASERVWGGFLTTGQERTGAGQLSLPEIIEQARREWQDAQAYYNTVTDTDLIDHAVYRIQAAEKRYVYLMKKARQEGIVYSRYTI